MTFEGNELDVLRIAAKYARLVDEGRVTPEEYVDKLLDEFAGNPAVQVEVAADVVSLVPPVARDLFARRIAAARRPGYLRKAFGGLRRGPEAEHEAALRESAREKAWAEAIHHFLSSPELSAEPLASAVPGHGPR